VVLSPRGDGCDTLVTRRSRHYCTINCAGCLPVENALELAGTTTQNGVAHILAWIVSREREQREKKHANEILRASENSLWTKQNLTHSLLLTRPSNNITTKPCCISRKDKVCYHKPRNLQIRTIRLPRPPSRWITPTTAHKMKAIANLERPWTLRPLYHNFGKSTAASELSHPCFL
jgi:hypothetical protein